MFRLLSYAVSRVVYAIGVLLVVLLYCAVTYPLVTSIVCAVGFALIYTAVERRQQAQAARLTDSHVPSMSPIEYERFIARLLREAGWAAAHCGGMNDQGCDVLARLRGFRLVVQVKLHRGRCGNQSVQEIVGARMHYGAQVMAVVAPNGFTTSAVQLARSNGVHLLHHSALHTLERSARIP